MSHSISTTQSTDTTNLTLTRWMIREDVPHLVKMEEDSSDIPWTEENYNKMAKRRNTILQTIVCFPNYPSFEEKIIGCLIWRRTSPSNVHIHHLIIQTDYRKKGIACYNLDILKNKAIQRDVTTITTRTWERNLGAQLFLRKMGFKCIKIHKSAIIDSRDDVYEFMLQINPEDRKELE